jgi:hypothetical protein
MQPDQRMHPIPAPVGAFQQARLGQRLQCRARGRTIHAGDRRREIGGAIVEFDRAQPSVQLLGLGGEPSVTDRERGGHRARYPCRRPSGQRQGVKSSRLVLQFRGQVRDGQRRVQRQARPSHPQCFRQPTAQTHDLRGLRRLGGHPVVCAHVREQGHRLAGGQGFDLDHLGALLDQVSDIP